MKIMHVVTMLEIGGAQYNTVLSAADSIARGHDVTVVASPGPLSGFAREKLGNALIEHSLLRRQIGPVADAAAGHALMRLMRDLQPQIVHTHSSKAGILGRWASKAAGVPRRIHTAHGWGFHDDQPAAVRRVFEEAERRAAKITDKIVVVANANREKALARQIGTPDQYVTIRSGISIDADALLAERAAVRRELGIDENAFVVCSVANFKPQKAPLEMARIARRILFEDEGIHFVSVGDGPLRDRASAILGPSERVHLLGWRPDAPRILAACDLLLHTALFEGLPRVILEAVSLGLPVVSTNVDGIGEAVRNGENAFLFDPGKSEDMVRAVLRARRGELHPKKELPEEFTLATMFQQLDELYRSVAI